MSEELKQTNCPVCRRRVDITKGGHIVEHDHGFDIGGGKTGRCPGSGRKA